MGERGKKQMGYIKNHAIIITTYDEKQAKLAHKKAMQFLGDVTTELKPTPVNNNFSFAILPDGSKEGWQESDEFDKLRSLFIEYLQSKRFEDGSSPFDAVLVSFDEEGKVTAENIS